MRWFTPWQRQGEVDDYYLEQIVGRITGQYKVPIGDAVISTRDTCLGLETCEEMFTPDGYVLSHFLGKAFSLILYFLDLIFHMVLAVRSNESHGHSSSLQPNFTCRSRDYI